MCASNEPDNNRETRQEPNKRSTRRSNFFRIKQPPRQTTRKRETRFTSHSVEIVIDMLPIIIPTYMPTLGRIGGGLVVVSCVARGAQTRENARRERARCWSVAAVEYPPSDDCSPITDVWASSPQSFGSESHGELADRAPSPVCGMNGRFCLKVDWGKSARSSVSEGY